MINIQISIDTEIFLFLLIFILIKQIDIYILFIVFTLIHEICHMLTGVILGLKLKKFTIMPFGFKITFEESIQKENLKIKKLLIAIAGPLSNLVIMLLAIIFKLHSNIIYTNLIIALFNLIPIYPLDGGRILKSALSIKLDNAKTNYIVNKTSNIAIIFLTATASILILYIRNLAIVFVLVYLWYLVYRENKRYKLIKRVYDVIENN